MRKISISLFFLALTISFARSNPVKCGQLWMESSKTWQITTNNGTHVHYRDHNGIEITLPVNEFKLKYPNVDIQQYNMELEDRVRDQMALNELFHKEMMSITDNSHQQILKLHNQLNSMRF